MADMMLAQAQAQLDAWLAASLAVAKSQSYRIADRELTRADAGEVQKQIDYWRAMVRTLDPSIGRTRARRAFF